MGPPGGSDAPEAAPEAVYRLDLAYDGAAFQGWQSQTNGSGIQDHVEKALTTMLRHPVRVIGASRTDSGVHAEHQVAIFRSREPYDERRWLKSLNGLLPNTVGVTRLAPAPADFHPVHAAKAKAYRYRLWPSSTRHPLVAPYSWQLFQDFDVAALRAATAHVVGTHDFTSFCALDSSAKTRRRTILEVQVVEAGPLVDVWVIGEGFLKQMVRIVVGTLVDVGLGRRTPASVADVIAARDRTAAGKTAPAQGLSLVQIFYDQVATVAELRARLGGQFCVRVDGPAGP